MIASDLPSAQWRKSRRSGNTSSCVEVADNLLDADGMIYVRDSKDPSGPVLRFTPSEWAVFLGGVRDGEFDL